MATRGEREAGGAVVSGASGRRVRASRPSVVYTGIIQGILVVICKSLWRRQIFEGILGMKSRHLLRVEEERRLEARLERLRALRLVQEAVDEDPEISRLAHTGSPWELVMRMLEMRGAPRTMEAAQRLVGAEFPMSEQGGKPRDCEDTSEVLRAFSPGWLHKLGRSSMNAKRIVLFALFLVAMGVAPALAQCTKCAFTSVSHIPYCTDGPISMWCYHADFDCWEGGSCFVIERPRPGKAKAYMTQADETVAVGPLAGLTIREAYDVCSKTPGCHMEMSKQLLAVLRNGPWGESTVRYR